MTAQEALDHAVLWGTGRRSHVNLFQDLGEPGRRVETLALVAQADAAETARYMYLFLALNEAEYRTPITHPRTGR